MADMEEQHAQQQDEEVHTPLSLAEQLILSLFEDDDDMACLRSILSQHDGDDTFTDEDIDPALCQAAHEGNEEACRILFQSLSASGKEKYTGDAVQLDSCGPLHLAAVHCHDHVVRFLVEECNVNVNQFDIEGKTPLSLATLHHCCGDSGRTTGTCVIQATASQDYSDSLDERCLETCRVLVENGADPHHRYVDLGHDDMELKCNAFLRAIARNMIDVVRLLLDRGRADPNFDRGYDIQREYGGPSAADIAACRGHVDMLALLLECGAVVEPPSQEAREEMMSYQNRQERSVRKTALYQALEHRCRNKHDTCRMLVEHAKSDEASAALLRFTLEDAMDTAIESKKYVSTCNLDKEVCETLFRAGMDPIETMYQAIHEGKNSFCLLLAKFWVQVDPFEPYPPSPLHAAASLEDTEILKLFLDGSESDDEDSESGESCCSSSYQLHSICREPEVSLPAVKLMMERDAGALATVDYIQKGFFPFVIAAISNAKLDVIYTLLQACPDALGHLRADRTSTVAGAMTNTTDNNYSSEGSDDDSEDIDNDESEGKSVLEDPGPLRKKAKPSC